MDGTEFKEKLHKFYSSLPKKGIYEIFSRCKIIYAIPGHILFEFIVEEKDLDEENNFHFGCLATLFDVLMSSSEFPVDPSEKRRHGVTVDLNITYLGTAKMGEKLIIDCKTIKIGNRLAFFKAKSYKSDNKMEVIARATQTFAVIKNSIPSSKL
uniref:Thioesterase domain-containing protein n=1 Tax=Panagrolaimus sp. PS1159 TaxID=55785 RepID=A0AC35GMS1_9BILA